MSPLPLLACFLLLLALVLGLLYAIRRGIQEQQERVDGCLEAILDELDALSDLVEYEDEDETFQRGRGPSPIAAKQAD